MVCEDYTDVWDLAAGDVVRLEGALGTTLRVTRGTIWITLESDTRDVVLGAGEAFTIDRDGLTLIEAQRSAGVCVLSRRGDEQPVLAATRRFGALVASWLLCVGAARVRRSTPYF